MKNLKKMKLSLFLLIALLISCGSNGKNEVSAEKLREYANELYNKGLYVQAIDEYRRYTDSKNVPGKIRANITYTIANIYFDRLIDYQNALSEYLKIKHFYPESELTNSVNQKIIACLERMNKSTEAQQTLKEMTSLDESQIPENKPGEVVAEIGDRKITLGDLDFEIERQMERTPPELRPKKMGKEEKLAFLKQYVTTELIYNKAKLMGLDRDKEVLEGAFQAKKNLMAMKVVQEEMKNKVKIEESDLELYYEKNKEKFAEKDDEGKVKKQKTFDEAKEDIYREVLAQKQKEVMDELLINLMNTQNVKILTDKVK